MGARIRSSVRVPLAAVVAVVAVLASTLSTHRGGREDQVIGARAGSLPSWPSWRVPRLLSPPIEMGETIRPERGRGGVLVEHRIAFPTDVMRFRTAFIMPC
jgi:hypothetical protein